MNDLYTLERANKYQWASISGKLDSGRLSYLEQYLVGRTILDAGCGGGAYVDHLTQKGLQVTGIDNHGEFLQVARENGRAGMFVDGDITSLPFPDKVFDSSYCFDVLEHVDDIRAVKELARVTRNRLIFAVPKEDTIVRRFNLSFPTYQDPTHLRYYSEESFRDLFSAIQPLQVQITPELAVPVKHFVQSMVIPRKASSRVKQLYRNMENALLHRMLARASYKDVSTGLVAIVDL